MTIFVDSKGEIISTAYTPSNADVTEPNLLDMLPMPSQCTEQQREMAISWYGNKTVEQLGEFLRNTQLRIYREYYGNPKKKLVGDKLHNLYKMREMIHEAMRRKHGKVRVARAEFPSDSLQQCSGSNRESLR